MTVVRHDSSSVFAKPVEVQWGRFNSCSPAHVDSAGDLERLPVPAPVESKDMESRLPETDLTLQKYAYL